jgi:hypothetical protein
MKRFILSFLALLCIQAIGLNYSNHIQKVDLSKVVTKTVDYSCLEYQDTKQRDLCQAIEFEQNK